MVCQCADLLQSMYIKKKVKYFYILFLVGDFKGLSVNYGYNTQADLPVKPTWCPRVAT